MSCRMSGTCLEVLVVTIILMIISASVPCSESSSVAFVPIHSSRTRVQYPSTSPTPTCRTLFGRGTPSDNTNESKKTDKTASSTEEKKNPFIFLYGKPQYDWVTGKVMSEDSWVNKKRFNWAPNYTNYKKEKMEEDSKKGKK